MSHLPLMHIISIKTEIVFRTSILKLMMQNRNEVSHIEHIFTDKKCKITSGVSATFHMQEATLLGNRICVVLLATG